MLSNAYFLAKFRFDAAENEPAKILQNFRKKRKMHFSKMHFSKMSSRRSQPEGGHCPQGALRGTHGPTGLSSIGIVLSISYVSYAKKS